MTDTTTPLPPVVDRDTWTEPVGDYRRVKVTWVTPLGEETASIS